MQFIQGVVAWFAAFWPLLATIIFVPFLGWFMGRMFYKKPGEDRIILATFATVVIVLGFLVPPVRNSFLQYIDAESALFVDGQPTAVFQNSAMLWRWDRRLKGSSLESYAGKAAKFAIRTNPITANPEVRVLVCEVKLSARGNLADYMLFRKSRWAQGFESVLQYYLWEFEQHHHGQLVDLYNPQDPIQQQKFRQLVQNFLQPYLSGTGVGLEYAVFSRP